MLVWWSGSRKADVVYFRTMKLTLLITALLLAFSCAAQTPNTLPAAPEQESPGQLIEDGARMRNHAFIAVAAGALASTIVFATGGEHSAVGYATAVVGMGLGVGLTIGGNSKQVKAGKLMRRRGM